MLLLLKIGVVLITLGVLTKLLLLYREEPSRTAMDAARRLRLLFTGFIANVADTIGLGSFAVVVALDKHWELVEDRQLPGTLNGQSLLPTMVQALFFLQAVDLELTTLAVLTGAATIGGFVGGVAVSRVNQERVRLLMLLGYCGMALLLIASKAKLLPIGGDLMALEGNRLWCGAVAMLFMGMLPAIGVGAYAPIQVALFVLGMAPIAAFPIMTSSGAFQQSLAALAFIMEKRVAVRSALLMGAAGVVGVLVAAPLITYMVPSMLRWLLLVIVIYNIRMLWLSYRKGS